MCSTRQRQMGGFEGHLVAPLRWVMGSACIETIQLAELRVRDQVSRRTRLWTRDVDAVFRNTAHRETDGVFPPVGVSRDPLATSFDFHRYLQLEGYFRWVMGGEPFGSTLPFWVSEVACQVGTDLDQAFLFHSGEPDGELALRPAERPVARFLNMIVAGVQCQLNATVQV